MLCYLCAPLQRGRDLHTSHKEGFDVSLSLPLNSEDNYSDCLLVFVFSFRI